MARSQRHTPITGHTTAVSEKQSKRYWNKSARLKQRLSLIIGAESPVEPHRNDREGRKDGKFFFDPAEQPKLMRK